ncbi:MAG: hypothetical protein JWO71_2669 [Candidatus Acidoferrum typicum]|nr:hypothetical protein [Candidatus Acidoferrum typicum]
MKIVIAGSSGLVGTALTDSLVRDGHTVVRLQRSGSSAKKQNGKSGGRNAKEGGPAQKNDSGKIIDIAWNPNTCDLEGEPFGAEQEEVEGSGALVNLAGASIADETWSAERKAVLRSSRIHITRELVCSLEKLEDGPKTIVSASAIGYYGNRGDEVLTEESKPGDEFLARLAQEWEAEAVKAEALGLRVVRLRFGIILAKHGGALPQMMRPFKFGLGGRMGSGQQWVSWIALQDAVSVIREVLQNRAVSGPVNLVAPQPVRNADFAQALGRAMHRPAIVPAPAFALEFALGEMAEAMLLASQRVVPSRLEQLGYKFAQRDLSPALTSILAER